MTAIHQDMLQAIPHDILQVQDIPEDIEQVEDIPQDILQVQDTSQDIPQPMLEDIGDDDVFFDAQDPEVSKSKSDSSSGSSSSLEFFSPPPTRLGSLSKDGDAPSPKKEEKILDDIPGAPLVQRCVIIQKDEKGYGLTVSGENPVFVESVKEYGAAARVGVKEGDRIIKVNGSMVANCNHKDVVKMIKSGTYVALTLVGRPPGHSRRESGDQSFLSRPSPASPADRIGGPQPADGFTGLHFKFGVSSPEKDQEFNRQKLRTIEMMYYKEKEHYEDLKTEHTKNPTEKSQSQLNDGAKTLKKLEEQLQYLQGSSSTDTISTPSGLEKSQFSYSREVSSTTPTEETAQMPFTKQGSGQSPTDGHLYTHLGSMDEGVDTTSGSEAGTPASWSRDGPKHAKTGSMPEPIYMSDEALNSRDAAIPRSVSDVGPSNKHQKLVGSDSCPHLAAGRAVLDKSRTSSLPTSIYDSGSLSDSNSPQHSPAPSPIPVQRGFDYVEPSEVHEEMATIHEPVTVSTVPFFTPVEFTTLAPTIDCITLRRAQIIVRKPTLKPSLKPSVAEISPVPDHEATSPAARLSQPSQQIMTIDDDDFSSEDEHIFDDHGPFAHFASLKNKPAHLAVFLHYLISNSDPSPMFFHLVTETYTQGNLKEMRKWAYEIHSTFLVEKAPLKVSIDEDIIANIDHVLQFKYEKEDQLKAVFVTARIRVHNQVNELLQDFRLKRSLGLGSLYGDHDLQDDLDRAAELKIVDKYLTPHLERLLDNEDHTDRNMAMALAITTFLKQVGVQRTTSNSRFLERCSSFIEKDKKMFRFKGSRKSFSTRKEIHYIKGHSLQAQHYHITTYCNYCSGVLWGVGNQGYQCGNCDQNYHKLCVEKLQQQPDELCSGAGVKKKDKKQRQSMLDRIIPRKPSANNPAARNDSIHQHVPPSYTVKDALKIHEGRDSDGGMMSPTTLSQVGMFHHVQPVQEDDDEVEGEAKSSGPTRVNKLVERYQTLGHGGDEKAGSKSPRSESPNSEDEKKDRVSVGRSESLKGRKEEKQLSVRRSKSDVASDDSSVMKALNQSEASSSSSSLSAKSESPSNSREVLPPLSVSHEDDSDFEVEDELPQLDAILSTHVLKKLKPKEKKRQEVINELFYTERSHVRNLKVLDRLFFRPWHNEPSLPRDLVKLLFPNLDELIELHKSMNDSMKKDAPGPGATYGDVGDILLNGLQGANGEKLCRASATFCQNQSFSLEMLKSRRLKDQKLAEFLREAESRKDLCRRLKLADLIPAQFQRLTKYKLLLENLLKYTQANTEEYNKLVEAVHCSKNVLNTVNKAVMDAENKHKVIEIQKRMDRRPIDNSSDPNVAKIKNLDLRTHSMIYDGFLTWKIGKNKQIDLHVVLCEDILVLLQRQDEKLVLKCQSTTVVAGKEDTKFTHSPVIWLTNLLTRNVATDPRAFFLVSTSQAGPQIYELVAPTKDERKKWFKYITEASEAFKSKGPHRRSTKAPAGVPNDIQEDKPRLKEKRVHDHEENTSADENQQKSCSVDSLENLEKSVEERPHLVNPQEVVVSDPVFEQAEPVHLNPIENLRKKDEMISKSTNEKMKIIAEILNIPHEDFDNIAELAAVIEGEKEPKELILASIIQTERLSDLVSAELKLPDKLPGDDYQDNSAPTTPKADAPKTLHITLPAQPVVKITQTLKDQLTQLLAIMTEREDETERLRQQLKLANDQIHALQEISRTPGHSRPNSYISIGSELSEIDESTQSGDEINKARPPTGHVAAPRPHAAPSPPTAKKSFSDIFSSLMTKVSEVQSSLFANSPGISMESSNSDEPGAIIQAVEENVEVCEEIADKQTGNAMETIHVAVGSSELSQEQDTSEEMQIETTEETPAIEAVEITTVTIVPDATVDESQTDIDTHANTQIRTGSIEDISATL
ncbi:uncharacterized protein LOC135502270 isoform X5 [Lineus longissimus]|uniref:uncharacterized protein LOC135502270 isoform X5 n=1 Tax=Lineus longissimus TaxID=88925 RepID=UPI00315CCD42